MSIRSRISRSLCALLVAATTTGAALVLALSDPLPTGASDHFVGSGNCAICHSAGAAGTNVLRNDEGHDISPPTHWRATMMANAARDPYWRAQVAAEVAEFPALQSVIEDKCTTCHSPMGRYEAVLGGAAGYSMAEALADPLALDAVSCTVCHQIRDDGLGEDGRFSGEFSIGEGGLVFGPYVESSPGPMRNVSGFDAAYGAHLSTSALCAVCHTLFTPFVHQDGSVGGAFPEQTPFLEWKNSVYPGLGTQCQDCHMPLEEENVVLTTIPSGAAERSPYGRHEFVGGNRVMIDLLAANDATHPTTAEPVHYDSTRARTLANLARAARLTVDLDRDSVSPDTLIASVTVENLAGHKLPTGFPSRRAWLHLVIEHEDDGGAVRFESGAWNPDGTLAGLDAPFEPHHDVIRDGSAVQVYESIMQDDFGTVTTTLLRGAAYAKDNRIPPAGYLAAGPDADVTAPVGVGPGDDFNHVGGDEGSGSDRVTYKIGGLAGGLYTVRVSLLYQPIKPSFTADLLAAGLPETDTFAVMLGAEDLAPDTIAAVVTDVYLETVAVEPMPETPGDAPFLRAYPNPTDGPVAIQARGCGIEPVRVFDVTGRRVRSIDVRTGEVWDLSDEAGHRVSPGTYFLRCGSVGTTVTVIR